MSIIFLGLIGLSIFGYFIEKGTLGDVKNKSKMVEAIEEDKPDKTSIEAKKTRWALAIYSFSFTRNFNEIFMRPSKSIKDKKFEVFNGLRFTMAIWLMMGNVYIIGSQYGNTGPQFRRQILSWILTQVIVSSDFALSFFYFMSGFIVMFALIKKYQRSPEEHNHE